MVRRLLLTFSLVSGLGLGCSDSSSSGSGGDNGHPLPVGPAAESKSCDVVTPKTALPGVSRSFGTVKCLQRGGNVSITVEPLDNAKDYLVYELPDDGAVVKNGTRLEGVTGATYRCAGLRAGPFVGVDGDFFDKWGPGVIQTLSKNQVVGNYTRSTEEATLGYVYVTPGDDRVPVFAAGHPSYAIGLTETEPALHKVYTTDEAAHEERVKEGWYDAGIAFYVPARASAETRPVYAQQPQEGLLYYFSSDEEAAFREATANETAFPVLRSAGKEGRPLMRVFYTWDNYQGDGGPGQDTLVVGKSHFERARQQGWSLPEFDLTWSGVTKPTTLVIEALDDLCPFQGQFSSSQYPADGGEDENGRWTVTPEQARRSAPHRELYVNGHNAASSARPNVLARTFIHVEPKERVELDFMTHFETKPEKFTPVDTPCNDLNHGCDAGSLHAFSSQNFDVTINGSPVWGIYSALGEVWALVTDDGAAGQMRMTAKKRAEMADDAYLYVVMDVNIPLITDRRYPQIVISDRPDVPLWISTRGYNPEDAEGKAAYEAAYGPLGRTFLLQPFLTYPYTLSLEVCDRTTWAVNNQCPTFDLEKKEDGSRFPSKMVGEGSGFEKSNRLELYASARKAYVFLDEKPFGCAELDPSTMPTGKVSVTFGSVIYHIGADWTVTETMKGSFLAEQKGTNMESHISYAGFSSGVAAPKNWPSTFPCAKTLQ
jgi:hypothetical protein